MRTVKAKASNPLRLLLPIIIVHLFVAAVFVLIRFSEEGVRRAAAERAARSLGKHVSIARAEIGLSGITLSKVVLHERMDDSSPVLLSIKSLELPLSPGALFPNGQDGLLVIARNASASVDSQAFTLGGLSGLLRSGTLTDSFPGGRKIKLKFEDCALDISNAGRSGINGRYVVSAVIVAGDSIVIEKSLVTLPAGRGSFQFSGAVQGEGSKALATGTLRFDLRARHPFSAAFPRLKDSSVIGTLKNATITGGRTEGRLVLSIRGHGRPPGMDLSGRLLASLDTGAMEMTRGKLTLGQSSAEISRAVLMAGRGLVSFDIRDIDLRLKDSIHLLSPGLAGFSGQMKGRLSLDKGLYNGRIDFSGFSPGSIEFLLPPMNGQVVIRRSRLTGEGKGLIGAGSQVTVSLRCESVGIAPLMADISWDRLSPDMSLFRGRILPLVHQPLWSISGILSAGELSFGGITASKARGRYVLQEGRFSIEELSFEAGRGTVEGALRSRVPPCLTGMTFEGRFQGIDLPSLSLKNRAIAGKVSGELSGRASLRLSDENPQGTIDFTLTGGRLVDTGLQKAMSRVLVDIGGRLKVLDFTRISGAIDLEGNRIRINSFNLLSEHLKLGITGTVKADFSDSSCRVTLDFTEEFAQGLPLAYRMTIKKYLREGWYRLTFIQDGDIQGAGGLKRID